MTEWQMRTSQSFTNTKYQKGYQQSDNPSAKETLSLILNKHRARLNIECSRMKQGICYDQTYTPVSSWSSICILLIMVSVHICYTKQLDCVELLPQALVEQELYMQIPKGIKLYGKDSNYYMLQLHTNTHGQKILTEYGLNN